MAVTSVVTIVGSRHVADPGYHVTGSLGGGKITLRSRSPSSGSRSATTVRNVSAFATTAPAEDRLDCDELRQLGPDRGRDAAVRRDDRAPPSADSPVSQVGSPNPREGRQARTFTVTVRKQRRDAGERRHP